MAFEYGNYCNYYEIQTAIIIISIKTVFPLFCALRKIELQAFVIVRWCKTWTRDSAVTILSIRYIYSFLSISVHGAHRMRKLQQVTGFYVNGNRFIAIEREYNLCIYRSKLKDLPSLTIVGVKLNREFQ